MAQKLEDMLDFGENIIFRSRCGRAHIVFGSAILTTNILALLVFAFDIIVFTPIGSSQAFTRLWFILPWGLFTLWIVEDVVKLWRRMILVTDRRVLYQHGKWGRKITEIPISDIRNVELGGWFGKHVIHARIFPIEGSVILVGLVTRLAELRSAVAAQVEFPPQHQVEPIVKRGIYWFAVGAISSGVAIGVLAAILGNNILQYWELSVTGWLSDSTETAIIGWFGFLLFVIFGFFVGLLIGYLPTLAVLHLFLTPDQARQIICRGYASVPDNWTGKAFRWQVRQHARFLSWLYGQEIRCE